MGGGGSRTLGRKCMSASFSSCPGSLKRVKTKYQLKFTLSSKKGPQNESKRKVYNDQAWQLKEGGGEQWVEKVEYNRY